jgi:hypothetical protein
MVKPLNAIFSKAILPEKSPVDTVKKNAKN